MKDQKIIQKLKEWQSQIQPRPDWKKTSREFLLSQIKSQRPQLVKKTNLFWDYGLLIFQAFRQKLFQPAVIMGIILGAFLISSFVVNAAFYSMPGDFLYPLKLSLEKTQLALSAGEAQKAQLKMEFAENRLKELDSLILQASPEQEKISLILDKFNEEVVGVQSHLLGLKKEKSAKLTQAINLKTDKLAKNLLEKELPEEAKQQVKIALSSTEDVSFSTLQILVEKYQAEPKESEDSQVLTELLAKKIAYLSQQLLEEQEVMETKELVQKAQNLLKEAEILLGEKKFSEALAKILEAKNLIEQIKEGLEAPDTPAVLEEDLEKENLEMVTSTFPIEVKGDQGSFDPSSLETTQPLVP